MSEYLAFSGEDFDVKKWINETLEKTEEDQLDTAITSVLTKLQLLSDETGSAIEDCVDRSIAAIPQINQELPLIQLKIDALNTQLQSLSSNLVTKESANHSDVLSSLFQHHKIYTRMKSCKERLSCLSDWSTLMKEFNLAFEADNIREAAGVLSQINNYRTILNYMPGQKERDEECEQIQQKLLNLLQIRLKQALQTEDIDTLREYGVYFDQIGQIEQLVSIYCESKNDILTKEWKSVINPDSFVKSFELFLDSAQRSIQKEHSRCEIIFGTLGIEVKDVYPLLFNSMLSPLTSLFETYLPTLQVEIIPNIFNIILKFIENVLISYQNNKDNNNNNKLIYKELYYKLLTIFPLFLNPTYSDYENQFLNKKLDNLILPDSALLIEDISNYIDTFSADCENLNNTITDYFNYIHSSINRNFINFNGLYTSDLIRILNSNILSFYGKINNLIKVIKDISFLPENSNYHHNFVDISISLLKSVELLSYCLNETESVLRDKIFKSLNSILNPKVSENSDFNWSDLYLQYEKLRYSETIKLYKTINDPNLSFQLLSSSFKQLKQTVEQTTLLLYDLCTKNLINDLKTIHSSPIWNDDSVIINDTNLLPSSNITHLGESVLQLLEILEPLDNDEESSQTSSSLLTRTSSSDDNNSKKNESSKTATHTLISNCINNINLSLWKALGGSLGINKNYIPIVKSKDDNDIPAANSNSPTLLPTNTTASTAPAEDDEIEDIIPPQSPSTTTPTTTTTTGVEQQQLQQQSQPQRSDDSSNSKNTVTKSIEWLIIISEGLLGNYIMEILSIENIKVNGKNQLNTDISYVKNIFTALGLEIDPIFDLLSQYLQIDVDGLKKELERLNELLNNGNIDNNNNSNNNNNSENILLKTELAKWLIRITSSNN